MTSPTTIEWTSLTWNPVTGCSKISPGCAHCYAERMARRLKAMGQPNYQNEFRVTTHEHTLEAPLRMRAPRAIFVNSMSDLFHKDVPFEFIEKVFRTMSQATHHRFQILTKRSERLVKLSPRLPWPDNVWMGVSVENEDYLYRIDHLRGVGAKVKILSLEPLLGPLPSLDLEGIDWVIVGGESGPGSRPISKEWIVEIRDRCVEARVPFFFKQWGGTNKKKAGRMLEGKIYEQFPVGVATDL